MSSRGYRALRAYVLATQPPICAWCGGPIDLTLSGNHMDGPHVDHIQPRALGGTDHPTNLRPMHKRCNLQRGIGPTTPPNTRSW